MLFSTFPFLVNGGSDRSKGNGFRQAADADRNPVGSLRHDPAIRRDPGRLAARSDPVLRPTDSDKSGHVQGHSENQGRLGAGSAASLLEDNGKR